MSYYVGEKCYRVYGPLGRRKDGRWSKRRTIWAAFRFRTDAFKYVADEQARMGGRGTALKIEPPYPPCQTEKPK